MRGGNGPGTWTFHSRKGEAVWPVLGITADLDIERFDSGGVVIRRRDTSQKSAGFSAVYTGRINGKPRRRGCDVGMAGPPERSLKQ
jgi:hypothetical protein